MSGCDARSLGGSFIFKLHDTSLNQYLYTITDGYNHKTPVYEIACKHNIKLLYRIPAGDQ